MPDLPLALLTAAIAYLIGGIPFGYLIARSRGVDIFKQGSGNIGATNVGRVLGRKFGIFAFTLDFAKGALPVVAAMAAAQAWATHLSAEELGVLAGLSTVLGHLFPVYLRFRGGKGVATAAGVVVVLLPLAALVGLLFWIGIVSATRYVSAGSLAAAVTLCGVRLATTDEPFAPGNLTLTLFCFVAAGLVILRHRANITRLLHGNENRLKEHPAMNNLIKVIHVLALGLWFGTAVFFSFVVGLTLFAQMDQLVQRDTSPEWFTVTERFYLDDDKIKGRYEYGTRIAGQLISPMFDWYFLIQGLCGFLAVATAWGWQYAFPAQKIHRRRVTVLLLAVATVVIGWPLERHVSELRHVRHEKMDTVFAGTPADFAANKNAALEARSNFGLYHTYSLFLNFATIALVAIGMGMAAFLPGSGTPTSTEPPGGKQRAREPSAASS
jgi:acyl-phosphate glycerol 3-phosphate acyltransferase